MSSDKIPDPKSPELTTRPEAPTKTSSLTNAVRARSGDPDPTDEEKTLEPGPDHEVEPEKLPGIGRPEATDKRSKTAVAATDQDEALNSTPGQKVEQQVRHEPTSYPDISTQNHQTEQPEVSNDPTDLEKAAFSASLIPGSQSTHAEVTTSTTEDTKTDHTPAFSSVSVTGDYEPQPAGQSPGQDQYLPEPTTSYASQSTADLKEATRTKSGQSGDIAATGQDKSLDSEFDQTIEQQVRREPTVDPDRGVQNHRAEQSEVDDNTIASEEKEASAHSIPLGSQSAHPESGGNAAAHATADHVAPVSLEEQDDTQADANKSHPTVALTEQEQNPSEERPENIDQPTIEVEETAQLEPGPSENQVIPETEPSSNEDSNQQEEETSEDNEPVTEKGREPNNQTALKWYECSDLSPEIQETIRKYFDDEEMDKRKDEAYPTDELVDPGPEREFLRREDEARSQGIEAYVEFAEKTGFIIDDDWLDAEFGPAEVVKYDIRRAGQDEVEAKYRNKAIAFGLYCANSSGYLEVNKSLEHELGEMYDATSRLAPIYTRVAEKMLPDLKEDINSGHQRIVFTGRDGKPIAIAVRQLDPEFYWKHCSILEFSRNSVQKAALDPDELERIGPEEAGKRIRMLNRNFPIPNSVAGERGEYKSQATMLKKAGVDVNSKAPITIVDNGAKGTVSGTLECIFPDLKTQSRFIVAIHLSRDSLKGRKEGYLGNIRVPRNAPDKPYLAKLKGRAKKTNTLFTKREPTILLEEIFQGAENTMTGTTGGDSAMARKKFVEGEGAIYRVVARHALQDDVKLSRVRSEGQNGERWKKAKELLFFANLPPGRAARRIKSHKDREFLTGAISKLHKILHNPIF
ncbi:hypothetical protein ACH4TQ_44510 [Streptomyces sp. NPDC021218]|uniref:hypothetical protein n=1 Tax=Streptomyces sp. NPDC021218 TaxID=3365119 RepID=UPI0037B3004F